MGENSRPVYSTNSGRLCPDCTFPVAECRCKSKKDSTAVNSGNLTISRERKGRGGKEVTVIQGVPLDALGLKLLASELKGRCASGGTVIDGKIEVQGDHRLLIKRLLEAKNYRVKLSGG